MTLQPETLLVLSDSSLLMVIAYYLEPCLSLNFISIMLAAIYIEPRISSPLISNMA